MNEGIDPNAFEDGDLDINRASLAKDIFKSPRKNANELNVDDLFVKQSTKQEPEVSTDDLFKIALTLNQEETDYTDSTGASNMNLFIIIATVIVLSYIYYLVQRSKITTEISNTQKQLNQI